MPQQRLQKILAQAGVASRRRAEQLISAGRVTVDGKVVTTLGSKADPTANAITVDGKPLPGRQKHEYWLLNKPKGVVSTASDPQGRPTVLEFLPPEAGARLYPVGRLDLDSEGLVLLTNDGALAQRLSHPRHKAPKTYKVWVEGIVGATALERLRQGVELEDGLTAPARVYIKAVGKGRTKLNLVLGEGKKRQIRRMCEAVGHPVIRLLRVGLGPAQIG